LPYNLFEALKSANAAANGDGLNAANLTDDLEEHAA